MTDTTTVDETASTDPTLDSSDAKPESKLSKNALKRLRRKEKFDQFKAEKRRLEREKRKKRYADAREKGITLGPSRKQLKKNRMKDSSRKETIVIDCDFNEYMAEKDINKLVSQIERCYSINRRLEDPIQFHCTSIIGKTKKRLEIVGDYKGWDLNFHEKKYSEVFPKEKIVYLSSESDDVLTELRSDEVYIIGGLVDHNHHKGLCHRLAVERGIRHARLPIGEFVKMQTRRVLTIDQVFNILSQYLLLGQWDKAFYEVIPKRKGVTLLDKEDENKNENESGEDREENDEEEGERKENLDGKGERKENLDGKPSKETVTESSTKAVEDDDGNRGGNEESRLKKLVEDTMNTTYWDSD